MSDIVANPLHLLHQPLKFTEHAVDHDNQAVEIIGPAMRRQALRQISAHNALDGECDPVDALHRIRSDELHAFAWLLGVARTPLTRAESDPALAAAMS